MEKQSSFSRKPIRFLVFSFTIFFTITFLIFFSTWVFKTIPSFHIETHNTHFNSSSDFSVFNKSSSENVLKNSILTDTHFGEEVSSRVVDEIAGNLSFSFSKSLSVNNSSNASYSSDSQVVYSSKLGYVTGESKNITSVNEEVRELNVAIDSNSGKQGIISDGVSLEKRIEAKNGVICDITKGKWVFDESYPLYTNGDCPFIDEGFSCEVNGRMDKDYMKWRWQPQDCDIPRFNTSKMLELIRGKRLVFVGDSLNRNQWESMLCLLIGGVKDRKKVYETHRRKITNKKGYYRFKFEEYQCTVEYYVTHFIVHESKARVGKKQVQTLRIDTMDKGASRWRGADILVFNTAHWWSHYKTKAGINYYQEGNQVHPQLDVTEAFKKALLTWSFWVDMYINPHKTRIFFRSSAPSHFSGGSWNAGGHCKEALHPLNENFTSSYPYNNLVVEEVISQMKNPVTFLNITHLSDYRPDGHPSIYGKKPGDGYKSVQDCSHWCLPGVPDIWNEFLFYHLQLEQRMHF